MTNTTIKKINMKDKNKNKMMKINTTTVINKENQLFNEFHFILF